MVVVGRNYERINGKDGFSQRLVGFGQFEKSGEGIFGVGNSKGKDIEDKSSIVV